MSIDAPDQIVNVAESVRPNEQANYFGFSSSFKFSLPDGVSWIEYTKMNEGAKKQFQDKTSRDVVLERGGAGNARINMLQGTERHELLRSCIVGWNLRDENGPVAFAPHTLSIFLNQADPAIVEELERVIRKANPWLLGEMTVEDIDKQMSELSEMREDLLKRQRGEGS